MTPNSRFLLPIAHAHIRLRRSAWPLLVTFAVAAFLLSPAQPRAQTAPLQLQVSQLPNRSIQLAWRVQGSSAILERADRIGPGARWAVVPGSVTINQGLASIVLAPDDQARFFRLRAEAGARSLLPSVRLLSPAQDTAAAVPFSIPLTAAAEAPDGAVVQVDFFAGDTHIGSDASAPYEATWTHAIPGTVELSARVTDSAGAVVRSQPVLFRAFDPATPPATTWSSSPAQGDRNVAIHRETVLRFSHPLADSLSLNQDDIVARAGQRRLLTRLELGADRRTITVFYLEPLPGSSRIRLTLQGNRLLDARGRAVDADLDGTYGGTGALDFDTLSTTPLAASSVVGRIFASQLQAVAGGTQEFVNAPLGGVTITVDGQEESLRTVTDAQGNFRLAPVPTGPFFVHIDGRTVVDGPRGIRYPDLAYYPNVNKRWEGLPGQEVQLDAIYLPLIPAGTLKPLNPSSPTPIAFTAEFVAANPQFDGVSITVPPNSLLSPDGSRGGRVGIAAVPPDRLPQPLPLGLEIQDVITIQTDGGQNFTQPVPACFPNLPDPDTGLPLPPHAKSALWSFNHDTGRFEIVGSATVSADGRLVCTDPGVGIIAPGWHGTREGTQGGGGPIVIGPGGPTEGPGPISDPAPGGPGGSSNSGPSPDGPGPIHGGGGPDNRHQPPGPLDAPPPGGPESSQSQHGPGPNSDTSDDDTSDSKGSRGGGGGGGGGDNEKKDADKPEDDCTDIGTAGKPISLFSGEEQLRVTDLRIKGRGLDFVWTRTYRSRTGSSTVMGHNWDHSYNVGLYRQGADLVLRDGTGRQDLYRLYPDGSYRRDEFFRRILVERDGTLTVVFANQGRWNFHPLLGNPIDGRLRELRDRNGNSLRFQYDNRGRLTNVVDTLDRSIRIAYHPSGFLASLTDFTGRQVRYTYYTEGMEGGSPGDLHTVTSPAVNAATLGNTFPNGRTTTYTYSTGFADERLNHNLLTATDPRGQTYLRNTYAPTLDSSDLLFDRVIRQQHGGPSDLYHFTYLPLVPSATNGQAVLKTIVNDRVGNVREHFFDSRNRLVIQREFTGRANPAQPVTETSNRPRNPLRASDPAYFETRTDYNDDALPIVEFHPNGNRVEYVYESDFNRDADPEARANLRIRRAVAGTHSPAGDQTVLEDVYEYATALGSGGCCGSGYNFVTRHVDPRGNVTLHRYDERGNLTNTVARIPSVVTDYEYNAYGQLTARVHPDNGSGHRRRDTYAYHAAGVQRGYLASQTVDASGFALTTRFEYDPRGNPIRITNPRGLVATTDFNELDLPWRRTQPEAIPGSGLRYSTEFAYDANSNLSRIEVANLDDSGVVAANPSFTTAYTYGVLNELLTTTREIDATRSVTTDRVYDANRNLVLIRSGEAVAGRQTNAIHQLVYDERNLLFRSIRAPGSPLQSTTETDYDGNANPVTVRSGTERNPRIESRTYDGFDRLIRRVDPMGNVTSYRYDPNGNTVLERLDGESPDVPGSAGNTRLAEIRYTYDALNRLTRTAAAFFDAETQAALGDGIALLDTLYSPNSQVLRTVNDNGHATETLYDTANRPAVITDAAGNTTAYRYDATSNPIVVTQTDLSDLGSPAEVFIISNRFDNLSRLVAISDSLGHAEAFVHDSRNNVIRQIDPRGNVSRFAYDGLSRLVEAEQSLTATGTGGGPVTGSIRVRQTWDDNSRLTSRTDPNGNATFIEFDALDRETVVRYADGTTTTTTYDVHDNPVEIASPNGTVTRTTFDALNRTLRAEFTPGPGVAPDTTFIAYTYDGRSRILRAEDNDSTVLRAYNSLSDVTSESLDGARTDSLFDGVGNLLIQVYPSGRAVTNAFDRLERIVQVADAGGIIASYAYHGPYRIEQKRLGNETRAVFGFDTVRRQIQITHARPPFGANDRIDDLRLAWNASGRKTTLERNLPGGDRRVFEYDSVERLVASTRTPLPAGTPEVTRYTLDPAGNRLSVTGGPAPGAYTLNPAAPSPADAQVHQYSATPFDTRAYDANGNPTLLGTVTARYDVHDRLVEYQRAGGPTASYRYDALGRRIAKSVTSGAPQSITTRFTYNGWQIVEELDPSGALVASYAYGPYVDEVLAMDRAGERFYLHADDQYSVTRVTDLFGDVVEAYEYDDYGEPLILAPDGSLRLESAIGNPWLFTGRYLDAESGWFEFRRRHYDPRAGRFLTRDPAGNWFDQEAMGNAYTFLNNSPLTGTDPSGLDPDWKYERQFSNADSAERYFQQFDKSPIGPPAASKAFHQTWEKADPASHHYFKGKSHQELPTWAKPVDALAYTFDRAKTTAGNAIQRGMNSAADYLNAPGDYGRRLTRLHNDSLRAGNAGGEEGYYMARQKYHQITPEIRHLIKEGIKGVYHVDLDDAAIKWDGYEKEYNALKENPNKYVHDHLQELITKEAKKKIDKKIDEKVKKPATKWCKSKFKGIAPTLGKHVD